VDQSFTDFLPPFGVLVGTYSTLTLVDQWANFFSFTWLISFVYLWYNKESTANIRTPAPLGAFQGRQMLCPLGILTWDSDPLGNGWVFIRKKFINQGAKVYNTLQLTSVLICLHVNVEAQWSHGLFAQLRIK